MQEKKINFLVFVESRNTLKTCMWKQGKKYLNTHVWKHVKDIIIKCGGRGRIFLNSTYFF